MKEDRLLYIHRVAKILDCPRPMIYKLIYESKLKAVQIDKRGLRISANSLQDYIKENTIIPDNFHLEPDELEGENVMDKLIEILKETINEACQDSIKDGRCAGSDCRTCLIYKDVKKFRDNILFTY